MQTNVNHSDLATSVVGWLLQVNQWHRAVSIDIEGSLEMLDDPTKILLSVSIARRTNGRIEIKKFILNEETSADEARIFSELGTEFQRIRPLALIGYNNGRFDQVVLGLKLRQLEELFKRERKYEAWYWALRETVARSYVLDMMDPVRFEMATYDNAPPKIPQLENVLQHPRFKHLGFRNTKEIVSGRMKAQSRPKWDVIHDLWKSERKLFEQYIEGDVHDTLLLSEEIFVPKASGVSEVSAPQH
jgi:hypothetical protein